MKGISMKTDVLGHVQGDFDRARTQEIFSNIISIIANDNDELLSLNDVKSLLKSNSLVYKGVMPIKLSNIVGSEGRYRDFNRHFLPKHTHLRQRWESIDLAHYNQTNLPPITVYEIGGLYFVRDGNHRVSVAKSQGVEFIDAEVTSLNSEIKFHPRMAKREMIRAIIDYEKKIFFEKTKLDTLRPGCKLDFTSVGRYDEILHHIRVHKYYLNEDQEEEIPFEEAMLSWYDKVFLPIVTSIEDENVLSRFPKRTPADLYVWIVHMWDNLKRKCGVDYPIKQAVIEYAKKHGSGFFKTASGVTRKLLRNVLGSGIQIN
jgi:hypothetical protein